MGAVYVEILVPTWVGWLGLDHSGPSNPSLFQIYRRVEPGPKNLSKIVEMVSRIQVQLHPSRIASIFFLTSQAVKWYMKFENFFISSSIKLHNYVTTI